jgi:hypothetical protein
MAIPIRNAAPGRMVNGRFKRNPAPKSARNVEQGFHDTQGVFHPIRASVDYDPDRGGDGKRKGKKKKAAKKKATRKATKRVKKAPKKKTARKPKKKASRKKKGARR